MEIQNLNLISFRCFNKFYVDFSSNYVFISGPNGSGKSAILESIFLIFSGHSFRTSNDCDMIKKGENGYLVKADFKIENVSHKIETGRIKGSRFLKLDNRSTTWKDINHFMPCVALNYEDLFLVLGPDIKRRFFINEILCKIDKKYSDNLETFRKILRQKTVILKKKNTELLEAVNVQFSHYGTLIMESRERFLKTFSEEFAKNFLSLSGIEAKINYEPSVSGTKEDVFKKLTDFNNRELITGVCLVGPHRDKINLMFDKHLLRETASLGQARLAAIALRLTQISFLYEVLKEKPLVLMDDITVELDKKNSIRFREFYKERYEGLQTIASGLTEYFQEDYQNVCLGKEEC